MPDSPPSHFEPALLAGLDEPVRRYFTHAIREGAALPTTMRLAMAGHIKVGAWLPFSAQEEIDGRSFAWRARVGAGPLTILEVTDRYADGAGATEGRLLGRLTLFHADDRDTTRSAAGRTALETVFSPAGALPQRGVTWRAETDERIVATYNLPPERPEVHLRIDDRGAVQRVSALRWGRAGRRAYDYVPCGCEVHAERRFGDFAIPSSVTVGWWFDTPRYAPFFRADIRDAAPAP